MLEYFFVVFTFGGLSFNESVKRQPRSSAEKLDEPLEIAKSKFPPRNPLITKETAKEKLGNT
jgi:hypothetical protein